MKKWDFIVIGTGIGGSTISLELAKKGFNILILEQGDFLTDIKEAHSQTEIFQKGYFQNADNWFDDQKNSFTPGNYHYVGGNSKFYGGVMYRFREHDFNSFDYPEGNSPKWPFSYSQLEPFYERAESLYQVHGRACEDLSEPFHKNDYKFEPVPHEKPIQEIQEKLTSLGYFPSCLPLAINIQKWISYSKNPWDGFPNSARKPESKGKMDAHTAALDEALTFSNVTLLTNREVTFLKAEKSGLISAVNVINKKTTDTESYQAKVVCVSAGAANSAALLLRSKQDHFPYGVANSSRLVGKNFMNHNASALLAINPFKKNNCQYQKTLAINAFAKPDNAKGYPLGNIQLLGKVSDKMIMANNKWIPQFLASWIANHSVDWYVMSEDLPDHENKIELDSNNKINLTWNRNNMQIHKALLKETKIMLRKAGYPIILSQLFPKRTISHQCGTVRMGSNSDNSVLDEYCNSWEHENLYVVDASFFPSSGILNPSLTIAAQAIRVADHLSIKLKPH